jgi:hypothetical protein
MRLWSLHPKVLDRAGLVALWRESLLAQAVLAGSTKGYRHHPQLRRFQDSRNPMNAISTYLWAVHEEAVARGYQFDASKIARRRARIRIPVTRGQIGFEARHLMKKLRARAPERLAWMRAQHHIRVHPIFRIRKGEIEDWERQNR